MNFINQYSAPIAILLLALLDTFLYGYLWERKHYKWAMFGVVWNEIQPDGEAKEIVPIYRVVMFCLEVLCGIYIYIHCGLLATTLYTFCSYFPVKDVIYYSANWQLQYIIGEKGSKGLYWLTHWFQAGFWLFKNGFSPAHFFLTGIGVYVISILMLTFVK